MSYVAAVDSLYALGAELSKVPGKSRRFDLGEMRLLASALGEPQRRFPSILIAGTNGKGSTSATLASILQAAGYRTGLYTSPHLSRINERIRVDGVEVSDEEFARHYFAVDEIAASEVRAGRLKLHPSFFEMMTGIGFAYFAEEQVDIAVLEVGMGGRLDATNVVEPVLSIITDISLDHQEWLGDTLTEITREKAGILRRNGVLVTLPQHPEVNQVIGQCAVGLDVRGVNAADYLPSRTTAEPQAAPASTTFAELRNRYPLIAGDVEIMVDSALGGAHQQRNIALAIAAAMELKRHHGYSISPASIAEGIHSTVWPGRLELLPATADRPAVLLDVAHNPAGVWTLRAALSQMMDGRENRPVTVVFGAMRDKALAEMAQVLFPLADRVIATQAVNPRAATPEEILLASAGTGAAVSTSPSIKQALAEAISTTPPDGLVLATGSVFVVGEARAFLAAERSTLESSESQHGRR